MFRIPKILALSAALAAAASAAAPTSAAVSTAAVPLRGGDTCLSCKAKGEDWWCPSHRSCHDTHFTCALRCSVPCRKTDACTGCDGSGGFNCSCDQCRVNGFSNYCPVARECYHSAATCGVSCGSSRCVDIAQTCPAPLTCSANNGGCNAATETCCMDESSKPFCAPGANRTCCNYKQMTCGQDQVCDPGAGMCVNPLPPSKQSTTCRSCQQVAEYMMTHQTCVGACANITGKVLHAMCELSVKLGICQLVMKRMHKEYTPARTCEMIGLCGAATGCDCGYCTPQAFGQWCLAMPNRCPMTGVKRLPADRRRQERLALYRQVFHGTGRQGEVEHFCVDGHCDKENAGCCLTCAP